MSKSAQAGVGLTVLLIVVGAFIILGELWLRRRDRKAREKEALAFIAANKTPDHTEA